MEVNRVSAFYKDKTILITGGTGFLGKTLIEKLLRSCSNLKKIYVILREKRGKNITQRLKEIFDGPFFDTLRNNNEDIFKKIHPIFGDLESSDMDLSAEDRKRMTEEVELIFHCAATVQFDEPFKKTILLNVRGTKLMLELAEECTKLITFCHVSTAYCQENQEVLEEKMYPPPVNPQKIIDICEELEGALLDKIADQIRGHSANNYTFAKALGEGVVSEKINKLPVLIVRPSAVVPIMFEPLPGWTDNLYGPMGLLIGAGKGVLRTMYGKADSYIDYIPVDIMTHCMICIIYDYVTYRERNVYNCTGSDEVTVTFKQLIDLGKSILYNKLAFDVALWYPGGNITNNRLLHNFRFYFTQLIPAYIGDFFLNLFGIKPFLVKVQKRVVRGYKMFEYYANHTWRFNKERSIYARSLLNKTELETFKVNIASDVDLELYFYKCVLGARRYLLKEPDENIPMARRRMKILWLVDKITTTLMLLLLLYFLYKIVCLFF